MDILVLLSSYEESLLKIRLSNSPHFARLKYICLKQLNRVFNLFSFIFRWTFKPPSKRLFYFQFLVLNYTVE